jgi:hypothetical protein
MSKHIPVPISNSHAGSCRVRVAESWKLLIFSAALDWLKSVRIHVFRGKMPLGRCGYVCVKNRLLLCVGLAAISTMNANCLALESTGLVTAKQVVDVPAKYVFEAVRRVRAFPGHTLQSYDGKNAVVKENWTGLPIIGDAVCVYEENEISPFQIDYHLLNSDKITKFQGSWTFQPADGGKKTVVSLSTATEANIKLPFAQMITQHNALKRAAARIKEVAAEAAQLHQRNLTSSSSSCQNTR